MKIFFSSFSTFILFFIFSSCYQKKISSPQRENHKASLGENDPSWQLKYRIPNCDSALVFMNQILEPVESKPYSEMLLPRERLVVAIIPGEGQNLEENERYKYYINPDCLLGKPSKLVFQLFCRPESIESFVELDKRFVQEDFAWLFSVRGFGAYLDIRLSKGLVESAIFSGKD